MTRLIEMRGHFFYGGDEMFRATLAGHYDEERRGGFI